MSPKKLSYITSPYNTPPPLVNLYISYPLVIFSSAFSPLLKRKSIIHKHRNSCLAIFSNVQQIVQILPFTVWPSTKHYPFWASLSSVSVDNTSWLAHPIRVLWASAMIELKSKTNINRSRLCTHKAVFRRVQYKGNELEFFFSFK